MELKEKLINYINDPSFSKVSIEKMALDLEIDAFHFKEFMVVVNELIDDGTLYQNKQGLFHNALRLGFYIGHVSSLKRNYGIITLNNGQEIQIRNEYLSNAYLKDKVRIRMFKDGNGEVISVLKRNTFEITAFYIKHMFLSTEKNFPFEIKVKKSEIKLINRHLYLLHIDSYNDYYINTHIIDDLGEVNDPLVIEKEKIIQSDVPFEFDLDFLKKVDELLETKNKDYINEKSKRKDLTDKLIVSIDGIDAKDLDDTFSLSINEKGNYELGVHIADVSYYVEEDSFLDKEAFNRGTSIYLPDKVIPMLPFKLSNELCSLNKDEEKLTISCLMEIDNKGELISYEIFPSVIKSKARLNYDEVNDLFNGEEVKINKDVKEMLFLALDLSHIISKKMENEGYISLEVAEPKIIIDPNTNKVINIDIRKTYEAEKLIENFMIMANKTVASAIFYLDLPFIYRVHPKISKEKLDVLSLNLKNLGMTFINNSNYLDSNKINDVLDSAKGTDLNYVVNDFILKSMSKAYYSINNIGHFGLGLENYTHFTSPIRRYPDLVVHRYLRKYLFNHELKDEAIKLDYIALNSSSKERRAIKLERDITDIKMAEYMDNHIGEEFEGIVSSITDYGFFINLNNGASGLLRNDDIEVFYFDEYKKIMNSLHVGVKIIVRVESTYIRYGEINFVYVKKEKKKK